MNDKIFPNTKNITSEDVEKTLRYISPIIGVPYSSIKDKKDRITEYGLEDCTISQAEKNRGGVFGRKANIERIDIALGEKKNVDSVISRLVRKVGPIHIAKPIYGGSVIPVEIPINGDEENGFVEARLYVGNPDLLRFTHREPDPSLISEYDNVARNELMRAVLMDMRRSIRDENTREVMALVGPAFYNDRGIVNQWRHYPINEDGTRSKILRPISRTEFAELYPDHLGKEKEVRLSSPSEIMEFMFPGVNVKEDDFESFESLRDLVIEHKSDRVESVFNYFAQNMQRRGLTIPEGLIVETIKKVEYKKVLKETRQISLDMISESIVKRGNFNDFRRNCIETFNGCKGEDFFTKPKINADIMPKEGIDYLMKKCGVDTDLNKINENNYGTNYHHRINDLHKFYEEFCELLGEEDFFKVVEHYDLKMTPESFVHSLISVM